MYSFGESNKEKTYSSCVYFSFFKWCLLWAYSFPVNGEPTTSLGATWIKNKRMAMGIHVVLMTENGLASDFQCFWTTQAPHTINTLKSNEEPGELYHTYHHCPKNWFVYHRETNVLVGDVNCKQQLKFTEHYHKNRFCLLVKPYPMSTTSFVKMTTWHKTTPNCCPLTSILNVFWVSMGSSRIVLHLGFSVCCLWIQCFSGKTWDL